MSKCTLVMARFQGAPEAWNIMHAAQPHMTQLCADMVETEQGQAFGARIWASSLIADSTRCNGIPMPRKPSCRPLTEPPFARRSCAVLHMDVQATVCSNSYDRSDFLMTREMQVMSSLGQCILCIHLYTGCNPVDHAARAFLLCCYTWLSNSSFEHQMPLCMPANPAWSLQCINTWWATRIACQSAGPFLRHQ